MIFKVPLISSEELNVIKEIDSLKTRLSYLLRPQQRWYGLLSRMTLSRAIRGSNTIEGLNITKDDAAAVVEGEEPFNEKTEAWIANECYRRAMTYVLQVANDPYFQYNEAMIKGLHFMMLEYKLDKMPGQWRPGYISVINEETKEIVCVGPDAEQVPTLIGELISSLVNMNKSIPNIVSAAMAHLNLTMIHPFKDGNGRMARCLQTLVIVRDGTSAAQFCSIEEFLGNYRNVRAYYDVLALVGGGKWQPEKDALPWIRFCLNAHFIQAKIMLRRTDEMGKVWTELEEEVNRRGLPKRAIFALVDGAFGYRIRNIRYRKVAEVEDQTASRDLKKLVNLGLLVAQGEARGRFYVASDYIKGIREKHREKQEIEPPLKTS